MAITPVPSHAKDSDPGGAGRALTLETGSATSVLSPSSPFARGVFARGGLPRRGLALMLPVLAAAAVLVLAAAVYYVRWGFRYAVWHGHIQAVPIWLAFNDIGSHFASRIGDASAAVARIGYDGQYYYHLARDPRIMLQCVHTMQHCPIDANPLREERILYPLTARIVALNNPAWLHISLFLVNFAAILITVLIVGQLCVEAGASRWLGLAAGVFCGELLGLLHDLADPYAVMWVVLAAYFLRKNRPLWCAAAVGAALLAREQLVVVLPLLALPFLAQRRWRTLALWMAIALTPFVAWQAAIHVIFGRWGFLGTVATTRGVTFPFHGLWEYRHGPELGVTVAFVAVPLLFTILIALDWLRLHGLRALLSDPLPLVVLVYCALLTLTAYAEWEGMWASARLVAPAAALGIVIACGGAPALRHSYTTLLVITAFAPLLMLPVLY